MNDRLTLNETGVRWAVKERGGGRDTVTRWWWVGCAEADRYGRESDRVDSLLKCAMCEKEDCGAKVFRHYCAFTHSNLSLFSLSLSPLPLTHSRIHPPTPTHTPTPTHKVQQLRWKERTVKTFTCFSSIKVENSNIKGGGGEFKLNFLISEHVDKRNRFCVSLVVAVLTIRRAVRLHLHCTHSLFTFAS